jgi:hypothetical protein
MNAPALKTITVIETSVIKQGRSSGGKDWTLREITAVSENGEPIELKLKSFDDLKGTVQVIVERQDDEKYGTSYMLKLPRGSEGSNPPPAGARLGPKVDAFEQRLRDLELRVEALERPSTRAGAPYGHPPDTPPATTGGATF